MQPIGGPVHLTDEQALEWFQRMVDPGSMTERYMLIFNEDQNPVSEVSLHHFEPQTGTAMFNLRIAGSKRGKGYAQAVMRIFLHAFFNELGGRIMLDDIVFSNLRGQEVLLRFGFRHDPSKQGVFRAAITKEQFNRLCCSAS